jgi:aspartate/methionine/tyrosine aminotransferase
VVPCAGTYFITADVAPLGFADDVALCRTMTVEAGVTAVPMSAFYDAAGPRNFIRFCFSKRDEVLDEAAARLERWLARPALGARA